MQFICIHCGQAVSLTAVGTKHRNHCPHCLYSLHLDQNTPGDRRAGCGGVMEPVALSFKSKDGSKLGELCLIHHCPECGIYSKNRLAGDDDPTVIKNLFHTSFTKKTPFQSLKQADALEVYTQLYGRSQAQEMLK